MGFCITAKATSTTAAFRRCERARPAKAVPHPPSRRPFTRFNPIAPQQTASRNTVAFLLDDGRDWCSVPEAPPAGLQRCVLQASSEGNMAQLVLDKKANLTQAISMCLEVLGLGTSTPHEQAAAARSLTELCTHPKLRPAVDSLPVLRRLSRIIKLTESAIALEAAAEALFAIADDDDWQIKGAYITDVMHDALRRCIITIKGVAETLHDPTLAPDKAGELSALGSAAAAALRPKALHLLSPDELVEAAVMLVGCVVAPPAAAGGGGLSIITALHDVLQGCRVQMNRRFIAGIAVKAKAVGILVEVLHASMTPAPEPKPLAEQSDCSGLAESPVQLTAVGKAAFACLTELMIASDDAGSHVAEDAARQASGLVDNLDFVPLLQQEPVEASRALHALLIILHRCDDDERAESVFSTLLGALKKPGVLPPAAVMHAADWLLRDSSHLDDEGGCFASLYKLFARLLGDGVVTVGQLREQAPRVVRAAVGVLDDMHSPARNSYHPKAVEQAAAEVASHVLAWAASEDEAVWGRWLDVASLAKFLMDRLVESPDAFQEANGGGLRKCLMRSLQLTPPEKVWDFRERKIPTLAAAIKAMLTAEGGDPISQQLAAMVVASAWVRSGAASTEQGRAAKVALLELATSALEAATTSSTQGTASVDQLSTLSGTLNAAVSCLSPRRALTGGHAQPLSPSLPEQVLLGAQGDESGDPACLLDFQHSFANGSNKDELDGRRVPDLAIQLRWHFEAPAAALPVTDTDEVCERGGHDYGSGHTTIAAATAPPLLRAMGAAAQRVNQLAVELLAQQGGSGGAGVGVREMAVVDAALRVAGNAAEVVANCVPPGEKKC